MFIYLEYAFQVQAWNYLPLLLGRPHLLWSAWCQDYINRLSTPGMYRLRIVSPRRCCSRSRPCWDPHLLAFGFQTHLWFPEASDPWRLPPIPATAMGILTPNSLHASNPVTKPTGQTTPLFRPGLLRCNWQWHCIRLRCTMWWSDTHLHYEVITISHSHYYLVVVTVVRTFKM